MKSTSRWQIDQKTTFQLSGSWVQMVAGSKWQLGPIGNWVQMAGFKWLGPNGWVQMAGSKLSLGPNGSWVQIAGSKWQGPKRLGPNGWVQVSCHLFQQSHWAFSCRNFFGDEELKIIFKIWKGAHKMHFWTRVSSIVSCILQIDFHLFYHFQNTKTASSISWAVYSVKKKEKFCKIICS